jgi:hypothetical protein
MLINFFSDFWVESNSIISITIDKNKPKKKLFRKPEKESEKEGYGIVVTYMANSNMYKVGSFSTAFSWQDAKKFVEDKVNKINEAKSMQLNK